MQKQEQLAPSNAKDAEVFDAKLNAESLVVSTDRRQVAQHIRVLAIASGAAEDSGL